MATITGIRSEPESPLLRSAASGSPGWVCRSLSLSFVTTLLRPNVGEATIGGNSTDCHGPAASKKHRRAGLFAKQRRQILFFCRLADIRRSEPVRAGIRSTSGHQIAGEDDMANRDVLAVGTSAGGVAALTFLAKRFPRDFPAAVLVTIHLPSHARSPRVRM